MTFEHRKTLMALPPIVAFKIEEWRGVNLKLHVVTGSQINAERLRPDVAARQRNGSVQRGQFPGCRPEEEAAIKSQSGEDYGIGDSPGCRHSCAFIRLRLPDKVPCLWQDPNAQ